MASLTALDMIVIVLVCGGAILGLMRGFTSEVISIGTWIVAILALKFFYAPVSKLVAPTVGAGSAGAILTFALVFGLVLLIGKLVAGSIGARVRASALSGIDRALGFGFGALKGLIVATIGFLLVNLAHDTVFGGDSERPDWITQSRSHVLLDASSRAVVDFVEQRRNRKTDESPADNAVST